RRKFIISQAIVVVTLVSVAFSAQQQHLSRATAQVLLSSQNLASQLTGTQPQANGTLPDRVAQTQATVARAPAIFRRVLAAVPQASLTVEQLTRAATAAPAVNADILSFSVTYRDAAVAELLANAYAHQYTVFRRELDLAAINASLSQLDARIK